MSTEWREEMATGNEDIDKQHKELLRHFDDLLKAAMALRGSEEIGKLLWFLKGYVRRHFRDEEKLQLNYGFPDYQAHKAQHEFFFNEVQRLESIYAKQGASTVMIVAAIHALGDWLRNHFLHMDKVMIEFVRGADADDD
jgi:hemerythrin